MTRQAWLDLAQQSDIRERIKKDADLDDVQTIVRIASAFSSLGWDEAVACLHMVYAWMPTMLRATPTLDQTERKEVLDALNAARLGHVLKQDELKRVAFFANRSIVGASKLLHVLSPAHYAIWDSRVANVFLWNGVTIGTFSTVERYWDYMEKLRSWVKDTDVLLQCRQIRDLNVALANATDLRLVELVLFRAGK